MLKLTATLQKAYPRLNTGIIRYSKIITVLFFFFVALILSVARLRGFTDGSKVDIDADWKMGLALAFRQDQMAGREVHFTYGPLTQFVYGIVTLLTRSDSPFDGYALVSFVSQLASFLALVVILLLLKQLDWKLTAFILFTSIILDISLEYYYHRCFLTMVALILFSKVISESAVSRRLVKAALLGLFVFALQLVTFEMGLYSLAAVLGVIILFALLAATRFKNLLGDDRLKSTRDYLFTGLAVLGAYILGNLALSLFFTFSSASYRNFFDYQFFELEITRSYNNTLGISWALPVSATLVLFAIVIFTIGVVIRQFPRLPTFQEKALIAGLALIVLIELKSATVRSDAGHIMFGFAPVVVLFLITGYFVLKNENILKLVWLGLLVSLVAIWPSSNISLLQALPQIADGKQAIAQKLNDAFNRQVPPQNIVPAGLLGVINPARTSVVFPFQTHIAVGLPMQTLMPVLQTYAAGTINLQQRYIEEVERQKANVEIVYGLDDVTSFKLDNVQAISRTPTIFEYFYRNFRLKTPSLFDKGYMLLEAGPARTDMVAQPIDYTLDRSTPKYLNFNLKTTYNCSLLRVTPRITYSVLSVVSRPAGLALDVWQKGTIYVSTGLVPLETGKSFVTYIQLTDPLKFADIFGDSPVQQKPLDFIQIRQNQQGLLDVQPGSVDVEKLECITFKR